MSVSSLPTTLLNFVNTPDFLDTRVSFLRDTTGSYVNRRGQISYAPANAPRWTFDPISGECLGLIIEPQKTNSALYSEDFSNVIWVKTNGSVTVNTIQAPDAATTADTLIAQGAFGRVTQTVTITSGQSVSFSVYAKAANTGFLLLQIDDGVDQVKTWFNLNSGVAGTVTSGANSCIFAHNQIEPFPDGWYRCGLCVQTTSSLTFNCHIFPTSADNVAAANTDSAYVWGAQIENGGMLGVSSYIPTTASTVQRNSDNLLVPVSVGVDRWFNRHEGTIYFDWINLAPNNVGGFVAGGIADSFSNTIYVSRASGTVNTVFSRNSVAVVLSQSGAATIGQRVKVASAWSSTQTAFAYCAASTVTGTSTVSYVPASVTRFAIGCPPWLAATSNVGGTGFGIFRVAAYYPHKLTAAELETLTEL